MLRNQLAREPFVRRLVTKRSSGREVEEPRLRFARGVVQIRDQRFARRAMPAEIVVALGETQSDQLAVLAAGGSRERGKRGPRLRPPSRGEQLLGSIELEPELVSRNERRSEQPLHACLSGRGLVCQRELVIGALVSPERLLTIPCCL